MTATDLELLFKRAAKKFTDRDSVWLSGYIHGIDDAEQGRTDKTVFGCHDPYGRGYTFGQHDAIGTDLDDTLALIGFPAAPFNFRWWEREDE